MRQLPLALSFLLGMSCAASADGPLGGGAVVSAADPNNASYISAPAITPGTPFTATRGLYANCTGSGQTTVTMKDGTTLPWTLGPGFQQVPFSATNVTAVTGCTFGGLN